MKLRDWHESTHNSETVKTLTPFAIIQYFNSSQELRFQNLTVKRQGGTPVCVSLSECEIPDAPSLTLSSVP